MLEKRVTIKDVAADVGVSISVVSYVLNDSKNVSISEQTRKKVLASARKLGYVQNRNASILRSGKSYTLGVVSYWADSFAYASLIEGIKNAADADGYKVLIYYATKNTNNEMFFSGKSVLVDWKKDNEDNEWYSRTGWFGEKTDNSIRFLKNLTLPM